MITPAISVLSAVEGLDVADACVGWHCLYRSRSALLTVLFAIQFKGTAGIGIVFGPILSVWFVVIAVMGCWQIVQHPEILAAFNPIYGVKFLAHAGWFEDLLI